MSLETLSAALAAECVRKIAGDGVDVWITPNADQLAKRYNREDLVRITREAFQKSHGDFMRHSEPMLTWDREAPDLLFATARVRAELPYHMIVFTYCEPRNWIRLLTEAFGAEQRSAGR